MSTVFRRGEPIAVAIDTTGAALVATDRALAFAGCGEAINAIATLEREVAPRWVWWGRDTPDVLVAAGLRPARCWDLDAVHRQLDGGWRSSPALAWAAAHGLDGADIPRIEPLDLFSVDEPGDGGPVRADGHLDAKFAAGGWADDADRRRRWAELALDVHQRQSARLRALADRPAATSTAHSESTAELLCAELQHDGLPIDLGEAERIIGSFIGPRPADAGAERRANAERDERVLRLLDVTPAGIDLRNPSSVKSLLRRAGIEVDDTRAWRLERLRDEHPIVDALLVWRKAERIATTFGYRWLDEHVRDGRLHGSWSATDGAAGRMTATAGLHNMPAELRPAIVAEAGHTFVRADLGQIEPRILAAVSGDEALAAASADDDLYLPVAHALGVDRDIAKVAVLGAMYGQTTGRGAQALQGLRSAYPVAMRFLDDAARSAEGGRDLRTRGGRLVRMGGVVDEVASPSDRELRARAAARGRYGRNAMIQGAAAEFFKMWALIVRARLATLGGQIVLCLHDELLIQVPQTRAEAARTAVDGSLDEAAHRWLALAPSPAVRFVSETSVVRRWSDAK